MIHNSRRGQALIKLSSRRGIAVLPIGLILLGLIIAIGASIAATSFTENLSSKTQRQSAQALRYAEAGARDGLERISRNRDYSCASTDCYSIDFMTNGCSQNAGCARVTVSTGAGTSTDPKIITSKGQVKTNVRRIQVSAIFDDTVFGELATTTWQELSN